MELKKLKGKMVEKGYTQKLLSRELGLSPQSLNGKLNGKNQFTLGEAQLITQVLKIDNPAEIFFDK